MSAPLQNLVSMQSSNYSDKKVESIEHHEHLASVVGTGVLANNVNAKVVNPLRHLSEEELLVSVEAFCQQHGFQDEVDLFYRGALAAQRPKQFEDIKQLSEEDKAALRYERDHRFGLNRTMWFTIFCSSLGAMIQGWDNTGANGANLSFPEEFGIAQNGWLVGFVNSAPTIAGLCSTWSTDFWNKHFGRRGTLWFTGLFCVFPVLCQAFTHNWWELLICRLILGFALGIKIAVLPIYTSELAPPSIRGAVTTSFQLWVAFGILTGFCFNIAFYRIGRLAWRFQLAAAFAPAVPLLFFLPFCPESPRMLIKKGRYQAAFKNLCRIRNHRLQAARELFYADAQIKVEKEAFGQSSYGKRIVELFTTPRLRRASLAGFTVMLSQQLSGINIMAFYSSTIFSQAGYSVRDSLLASVYFGIVNSVFCLPAFWTVDTFGRRSLLLFTFPNMAWCLFVVAGIFKIDTEASYRVPLIVFFIMVFTAFYSPGIGPCPSIVASESFPLSHREAGMAFSIFINNTFSTVLSLTFPTMLKKLGPTGAFCFYGGTNLLATVLIFFFIPETSKRTLEELDYIFSVPTGRHASYQLFTWLPYFVKRRVLFNKSAKLEPLYNLEEIEGEQTENVAAVAH